MSSRLTIISLACLSMMALPVKSAQVSPEARVVLDRFIAAVGGKEPMDAIQCAVTVGRFSMPAQGLEGPLTIHQKRPNFMITQMELPGIGPMKTGFDGQVAWEMNPFTGIRYMEGAELEWVKRQSRIGFELEPETTFSDIIRGDDREGLPTLHLTTPGGQVEYWSFDPTTHLLRRIESVVDAGPQGQLPIQSVFEDYREIDGVVIPFRLLTHNAAFDLLITIDSIQHPTQLDDQVFAIPVMNPAPPEP